MLHRLFIIDAGFAGLHAAHATTRRDANVGLATESRELADHGRYCLSSSLMPDLAQIGSPGHQPWHGKRLVPKRRRAPTHVSMLSSAERQRPGAPPTV